MFCAISSCYGSKNGTALEELQNLGNWNKVTGVGDPITASKRNQFLARKIHKLKKIMKFGSNSLAKKRSLEERQNNENAAIELRQNRANEALERKLAAEWRLRRQQQQLRQAEDDQNMMNENWENWDSCYLCAGQPCQRSYAAVVPHGCGYVADDERRPASSYASICYVFMPGQREPVPVRLRTAKVPGGAMWISYQPDLDLRAADSLYAYTSSQMPQGQRAVLV